MVSEANHRIMIETEMWKTHKSTNKKEWLNFILLKFSHSLSTGKGYTRVFYIN